MQEIDFQRPLQELLKSQDLEVISLKKIYKLLENELKLDSGFFKDKTNIKLKLSVKTFVTEYLSSFKPEEKAKNIENSASKKIDTKVKAVENVPSINKRKRVQANKVIPGKYDNKLKKLNKMARAIGKSPVIFNGLPEDKSKRVVELSNRLKESGAKFIGKVPTEGEITISRSEYEKKKTLEGLSSSNIIETKSRRRSTVAIKYNVEQDLDLGSDEEEDDETEEKAVNESEEEDDELFSDENELSD